LRNIRIIYGFFICGVGYGPKTQPTRRDPNPASFADPYSFPSSLLPQRGYQE
jgi:hypothetical protein